MLEQYLLSTFWRPYVCHFTKKTNRNIYIKCFNGLYVAFVIRENTTIQQAKNLINELTND